MSRQATILLREASARFWQLFFNRKDPALATVDELKDASTEELARDVPHAWRPVVLDVYLALAPEQRHDFLRDLVHRRTEFEDGLYGLIISMAANPDDEANFAIAKNLLLNGDAAIAGEASSWQSLVGWSDRVFRLWSGPGVLSTTLLRDFTVSTDQLQKFRNLQNLIRELRQEKGLLPVLIEWQTSLSFAETIAVANVLEGKQRGRWLAAFLLAQPQASAEETRAALGSSYDALADAERGVFTFALNLELHNQILRTQAEMQSSVEPVDDNGAAPLLGQADAYRWLDRHTDFALSRQRFFPAPNVFHLASSGQLWEYLIPDASGERPLHPDDAVRRLAIEYLELSFLDDGDSAALREMTDFYHGWEGRKISREAKMLLDVLATIDSVSHDPGNANYEYIRSLIDGELSGQAHENWNINRDVRTALLIDPVATLADLPRWTALIAEKDPRRHEKFKMLQAEMQGILFDGLSPELLNAQWRQTQQRPQTTYEWLRQFRAEERAALGRHLTGVFTNQREHYGQPRIMALKLLTVLGHEPAVPVILQKYRDEMEDVLAKPYPFAEHKDLAHARFMLNSIGRLGNAGITAPHLQKMRVAFQSHPGFVNSHADALLSRVIHKLRQSGSSVNRGKNVTTLSYVRHVSRANR